MNTRNMWWLLFDTSTYMIKSWNIKIIYTTITDTSFGNGKICDDYIMHITMKSENEHKCQIQWNTLEANRHERNLYFDDRRWWCNIVVSDVSNIFRTPVTLHVIVCLNILKFCYYKCCDVTCHKAMNTINISDTEYGYVIWGCNMETWYWRCNM